MGAQLSRAARRMAALCKLQANQSGAGLDTEKAFCSYLQLMACRLLLFYSIAWRYSAKRSANHSAAGPSAWSRRQTNSTTSGGGVQSLLNSTN